MKGETIDYLRGEETKKLLEIASQEGTREELMVLIPMYTGCRIGEASALAVGDCEPQIGRITFSKVCFIPAELVTASKGRPIYDQDQPITILLEDDKGYTGKMHRAKPKELFAWCETQDLRHECVKKGLKASQPTRVVPIAEGPLRRKIADWNRDRESNRFVFSSQKGGRLQKQQIQRKLTDMMARADIPPEKRHPHILRHTYAVTFLKKNPGSIYQLARILGHTDIKTTAIYLRFVVEDLQALVSGKDFYAGP